MKSKSVRHTVRITVDDLLLDESFLNYYFRKDESDIFEWEDWVELYPERQDLVKEAFLLLDKLSLKWSREQIEAKLNNKIGLILEDGIPLQISYRRPIQWVAVASVILLLSVGWWYYNQDDGKSHIYKELVAEVSVPLVEKENSADKPLLVTLNDGSSILLQKGSRLSYPVNFSKEKREVYLDGEAFFEVAKDPKKPFFVFANELVTKVLGTSFNIKSYKGQKDIEVVVRTGKVSVFRLDEIKNNIQLSGTKSKSVEGVVIIPNQQINFDKKKSNFSKSLVEQPEMLSEMPSYNFEFKDASAAKVFATIQKAYGISIVYDEEILKECPVTASLSDEPLYGKLELVCNAIEAQYQLIDGQVVISSKGCRN